MAPAVIVISAYIAAQMLADITAVRIVLIAGLSIDAGTIVYPITFTLRDLAHKLLGASATRTLIISAAAINVAMAVIFWLVAVLPADPQVGPQAAFGQVLAPVWRIVVASIIAETLSELTDTEIYSWWVRRTRRYQWGRVLFSNAISVPLDSVIFVTIAFYQTVPDPVLISILISNILVKTAVTLFSLPTIYLVPER